MYDHLNIALRSSSPFALRCVPANHPESHSIHNDHRTRSLPSSPWRFPSSPASSLSPSQMGSVWTAECAYTHFLVIKSTFNGVNTGLVPRFSVPQNLRAESRAWSAGHSTKRSRALSFGHIVCVRSYHTFGLRLPELRRMFVSRAVAAEVLMEAEA